MKCVFKSILPLSLIVLSAACSQPADEASAADTSEGSSSLTRAEDAESSSSGSTGSTLNSEPSTTPSAPDLDSRGRRSVYSGVYTAAQAARGQQIQQKECVLCHTPDDWAEGNVLTDFIGLSAADLVERLRTTMPMDGPGRLTYEQYTDVAAYIFQLNGAAPGETELIPDRAELATIRLEYRR